MWVQDYRRKPGASGAMRHVLNTFSICDGLLCWVGFYVGGSDSEASAMRETWVQSLGREDPLEVEMATRSSTLTWTIPWMEEPGGLQSVGSTKSQTRLSNFTPYVGYIEYEIVFQKSREREVTQRKIFMKGPQKQRRGHGSAVKEHVRPTCVSASAPTLFPEGGQLGLRTRRPLPLDALRGPCGSEAVNPLRPGSRRCGGKATRRPSAACAQPCPPAAKSRSRQHTSAKAACWPQGPVMAPPSSRAQHASCTA